MKTWYWEGESIFIIDRDLQKLIDDKIVKTVVSMNLVSIEDKYGHVVKYSAILIYK
jgi:hypothetical protein